MENTKILLHNEKYNVINIIRKRIKGVTMLRELD